MTTQDNPPPATDAIDHDVDCIKCGYNLRGLAMSVTCPECGAPVAPSADPQRRAVRRHIDWLRQIHVGLVLLLFGEIASCLASLLLTLLVINFFAAEWRFEEPFNIQQAQCHFHLGTSLMLIAIWFLTTPDPTHLDPVYRLTNRNTRLWIYGLVTAEFTMNMHLVPGFGILANDPLIVVIWSGANILLAMSVSLVVVRILRRLAERAMLFGVIGLLRVLKWLVVGHAVLALVLQPLIPVLGIYPSNPQLIYYALLPILSLPPKVVHIAALLGLCVGLGRARESLVMIRTPPPA